MSGFVYIWRDKKYGRYYVGSHWGGDGDGYICSSDWMRRSYRNRPNDFKRRVLVTIHTNRRDLLAEEFRWLGMVRDSELGKRYYNLINRRPGHWTADDAASEIVRNKLRVAALSASSEVRLRQGSSMSARWTDPTFRAMMLDRLNTPEAKAKRIAAQTGKKVTSAAREKMRLAKLGKPRGTHSEIHRQRISESQKGIPRPYARRPISEEQKKQISIANKARWAERKAGRLRETSRSGLMS